MSYEGAKHIDNSPVVPFEFLSFPNHAFGEPYVCPVCGHEFSRKFNLRLHYMLHTNSKPFKCPLCKHRSSRKANLRLHIQMIHKDNPNAEPICDQ